MRRKNKMVTLIIILTILGIFSDALVALGGLVILAIPVIAFIMLFITR